MRRRAFLGVVIQGLLATPPFAAAQGANKTRLIGLLEGPFPPVQLHADNIARLQSRGDVGGTNVAFERRTAGTDDALIAVATELARGEVDAIVASGLPAIRAAKAATKTIPIVMLAEGDPVAAGLVSSLARPGGNITGLTLRNPELAGKRLELLKAVVPGVVRVGVLWNPRNPESVEHWQEAQQAARLMGLELRSLEVGTETDIDSLFDTAAKARCGALLVSDDYLTRLRAVRIIALARENRIPVMYTQGAWWVKVGGGLMSYGVNVYDLLPRIGFYLDKILKGAKAAELPVEQPTKFELVINIRTAKALGLTMPPSLLLRADEIIE